MAHPNKTKGDVNERRVVAALRRLGWDQAERTRAGYERDRGDVQGTPGLVFQAKNARTLRWKAWLADLAEQVANANADHGVLVVKRPGNTEPEDDLAVMYLRDWAALALQAGYGGPGSPPEGSSTPVTFQARSGDPATFGLLAEARASVALDGQTHVVDDLAGFRCECGDPTRAGGHSEVACHWDTYPAQVTR